MLNLSSFSVTVSGLASLLEFTYMQGWYSRLKYSYNPLLPRLMAIRSMEQSFQYLNEKCSLTLLYFRAIFINLKVSLPGCSPAHKWCSCWCYQAKMLGKQVLLISLSLSSLTEAAESLSFCHDIKCIRWFFSHCMVQLPPSARNSGVPYHQTCRSRTFSYPISLSLSCLSLLDTSLPPSLLLSLFPLLLRDFPSRLVHKWFSLICTWYSCHLLLTTLPPVVSYNQTHVNLVSFIPLYQGWIQGEGLCSEVQSFVETEHFAAKKQAITANRRHGLSILGVWPNILRAHFTCVFIVLPLPQILDPPLYTPLFYESAGWSQTRA